MISDIVGKIQDAEQRAAQIVEKARSDSRLIAVKAQEEAAAYAAEQEEKARGKAAQILKKADADAEKKAQDVLAQKASRSEKLGAGGRGKVDQAVAYIVKRVG